MATSQGEKNKWIMKTKRKNYFQYDALSKDYLNPMESFIAVIHYVLK